MNDNELMIPDDYNYDNKSGLILPQRNIVLRDSDGEWRGKQETETTMFNYKSKELFINLEKIPNAIPPKGHAERGDFIRNEKRKCREGINLNGEHICGSLYYHWNFHTIAADYKDKSGRIVRVRKQPDIRDNDWELHNEYNKARLAQEAFAAGGARQIGKTETIVSMSACELFVFRNSEVLGLFSIKADKETYAKKMQVALEDKKRNFLIVPALDKDWTKSQIRFGFTETDNSVNTFSLLFMYLTEGGNNTEIAAGKSTTFFFFDEIAKYPMKAAYDAVIPALRGIYGFRCSPLLVFTGGNVEKGQDAKDIYFNPEANNIRQYTNSNKSTGFFMDATHRQDFKYKMSFAKFLGRDVPKDSELAGLTIWTSDIEKARLTLEKERKIAEQDTRPDTLLKKKIYDPLDVDEIFLSVGGKPFADYAERLTKHKDMLLRENRGRLVDIIVEGNSARWVNSEKTTIKHFPKKEFESSDCAVVMYEPPRKNNSYWLHAGGLDPYNTSASITSSSHGSFYLMRRKNDDLNDPFQDTMVLSIYSRPEKMSKFFETIKGVLMIYNGTMLHEQSNDLVLNYFDLKHEADKYLCKTWNLAHEINSETKTKSAYGLPPTQKNQQYIINCIKEELGRTIGFKDNGDEILGYTTILDPMLCEEIIEFSEDGNFDRIWGYGHAIVYCKYLDKYHNVEPLQSEKKEQVRQPKSHSPFNIGGGMKSGNTTMSKSFLNRPNRK